MKLGLSKSPVTEADAPRSAMMYLCAFLIFGVFSYFLSFINQPRDRSAYSGAAVVTKGVIKARTYEKGKEHLNIYEVRFPGNRGYLATRTIYVPKEACLQDDIGPNSEVWLELQDYKHVKKAVKTATTLSGCILYDENVRDELARTFRYQCYLGVAVMFVFCLIFAVLGLFDYLKLRHLR